MPARPVAPPGLDVLLVVPPLFVFLGRDFPIYPLGLGSLAAYLKAQGFTARIYNADVYDAAQGGIGPVRLALRRLARTLLGFSDVAASWSRYYDGVNDRDHPIWRRLATVLRRTRPKVVGITATVITMPSAAMVARIVREVLPAAKVVVGGLAASTCTEDLLAHDGIDFLVRREGEATLAELVAFLLRRDGRPRELRDIRGLVYRDGAATVATPPRPLIEDLDTLPLPDREAVFVLDAREELHPIHANADVLASRGCPFACRFCCTFVAWGTKKTRFRSVDNIVSELEHLVRTYGQRWFVFWDDLFTANRKRTVELCDRIIATGLRIEWACLVRLNTVDAELLALMKRAGCREIQVGLESGNDRVLDHIGKDLTVAAMWAKIPVIRAAGIDWRAFLIIGFPTETRAEIRDTLRLIDELRPTFVDVSIFSPYPGSALFDELKAQGRLGQGYLRADVWYPFNNYTGTMSDAEFTRLAIEALKAGDRHNNRSNLYGLRPFVSRLRQRLA